jgi:cytochrome bd-type quinol oxidase subunit 2
MAKQRWALVLLGAWIMGSIASSVVAAENFYTVDRLLAAPANPGFASAVHDLGQPQARELLRYLSSELNRLYFQLWNVAQLPIGALTLLLIASDRRRDRSTARATWVVAAMLAVVVGMLSWLMPEIVAQGRLLDFVPRDPAPPGMSRFWMLHGAYTTLELIKLGAGLVVAYWLAADRRMP